MELVFCLMLGTVSFWIFSRFAIFLADAITDPADFMVAPLIGNILVMINKTCCTKDDVVIDMIFINMC